MTHKEKPAGGEPAGLGVNDQRGQQIAPTKTRRRTPHKIERPQLLVRYARGGGRIFTDEFSVMLPYGEWITASGRRVLFNRLYEPIFEREGDGPVCVADPHEFIRGIVTAHHFYSGADKPSRSPTALGRCRDVLREWGVR